MTFRPVLRASKPVGATAFAADGGFGLVVVSREREGGRAHAGARIAGRIARAAAVACIVVGCFAWPARAGCRGAVSVSTSASNFSCVDAYNGPRFVAHAATSNECPEGSVKVDTAAGSMCSKTLVSGQELILRPGERCPAAFNRFVDIDGDTACRPAAQLAATTVAWARCANGSIPVITASGEECRSGGPVSVGAGGSAARCPDGTSAAVDADKAPICVMH